MPQSDWEQLLGQKLLPTYMLIKQEGILYVKRLIDDKNTRCWRGSSSGWIKQNGGYMKKIFENPSVSTLISKQL